MKSVMNKNHGVFERFKVNSLTAIEKTFWQFKLAKRLYVIPTRFSKIYRKKIIEIECEFLIFKELEYVI